MPRANWKGYLKLSLVSCPIALFPATTEADKVRFHQLNARTGNRIRYRKVDDETGDEVEADDIVKAFEVSKGKYIELTDEELEAVAIDSTRTIEIERFVPRSEIDDLFQVRPYYLAPEGTVGVEAYVTIRDAIAETKMTAIGRLVLTTREHMIAIDPRGKGLMGTLLRYPYEVRDEKDYFADIPNLKIDKEMLDLATHIVKTKQGHFKPEQFEDRYEDALKDLIARKAKGEKIEAPKQEKPSNVVDLMKALRNSVAAEKGPKQKVKPKPRRTRKAASHSHRRSSTRARKAG